MIQKDERQALSCDDRRVPHWHIRGRMHNINGQHAAGAIKIRPQAEEHMGGLLDLQKSE